METIPPDKLLHFLSPAEIDDCTDDELAYLEKQVSITPHSSFPTHQRIHERAAYLHKVIARKAEESQQRKEWDKWSAEMLQSIHIHKEQIENSKIQFESQKKSSRHAMIVSVVAALAAIASALFAFFQT